MVKLPFTVSPKCNITYTQHFCLIMIEHQMHVGHTYFSTVTALESIYRSCSMKKYNTACKYVLSVLVIVKTTCMPAICRHAFLKKSISCERWYVHVYVCASTS